MTTEQITETAENNHLDIDSKSGRIKTLEQLLKTCKVDLRVWRVERHVINKWEVGSKGPDGNIVVEPLFQVKAWLIKHKLEAVHPVVQPIRITAAKPLMHKPGRTLSELETALILPDPQFGFRRDMETGALDPFHDRLALDIALQVAVRTQPDRVVFLGDMLDLADWSDKFVRSPEFYWTTQAAVIETSWWIAKFRRALPAAEIHVLEGNHDKRLYIAQVSHLQAAYQLRPADELHMPPSLSVPRLLALDSLDVEYVGPYPDGEVWLNDRIVAVHGDTARSNPGGTAGSLVKNTDVTVIHGHTHRREWATRTQHGRRSRNIIEVFCPGCLCRIDGVVPGRKGKQQWQQGIALIAYQPNGERYNISPVAIDDGRAIFEGSLLTGQDRTAELIKESGWNGWPTS